MTHRNVHVVHLLVRQRPAGRRAGFLLFPFERSKAPDGQPYLSLPAKKTGDDPEVVFLEGMLLDSWINEIVQGEWKLPSTAFQIGQEFDTAEWTMPSPGRKDDEHRAVPTSYTVHPVEVWVAPKSASPCASDWKVAGSHRTKPSHSNGYRRRHGASSKCLESDMISSRPILRNRKTSTTRGKPRPSTGCLARFPTIQVWTNEVNDEVRTSTNLDGACEFETGGPRTDRAAGRARSRRLGQSANRGRLDFWSQSATTPGKSTRAWCLTIS